MRVMVFSKQVLDAPALQDDFYLNLVDWSAQNVLAVGLGTRPAGHTCRASNLTQSQKNSNLKSLSQAFLPSCSPRCSCQGVVLRKRKYHRA